ncbi:efflux RND transporter periplasmic adaptor subunit [Rhodopirellula sp. JC639]|uniref:efflux RND transporter periplasmic adaptor subunit n=1 Tax=Stieleria mannarensis TaxID=2755585 RepID=UPI001603B2C7|nr:efflux RND transporter periplasmic adaptor subunit [Rhodopirellula sp. JC639]
MVLVVDAMSDDQQHFASDQSTTSVVFRQDLRVTPCEDARQPHVVVEDPLAGAFYRLGRIEYALASRLTDSRTVAQAYRDVCEHYPDHRMSEDDAADLCRWLIDNQLAHTDSSKSSARLHRSAEKSKSDRIKQRINPIAIRIPLLHPDRLVETLVKYAGWIFSVPATVLGVLVMLISGCLALAHWGQLAASTHYLFEPSSLSLLLVVTVGLKVIHEFAHAIVCKRYGGDVGEMGVLLILLAPLAYVDVSSVWRFRRRWQRIHVASAGIYLELLVAAIAMLIWYFVDSPSIRHVCTSVMLSAGVATLVFNANPLMKFDGYFVLIDWARTPNLYTDSQNHLRRRLRCLFFGGEVKQPQWTPGYRTAVGVYAPLALFWKGFVCLGLTLAATKLFHGLGTLLAVVAGVCWIGGPAWRGISAVRNAPRPGRRRFMLIAAGSLAMGTVLLMVVPWPGATPVHAVVEYSPHEVVRAEVPGFVHAIHVDTGQWVSEGEQLLTLGNPELVLQAQQLETKIQQSTLRRRQQTLQGKHAAAQAEATELESLTKRLQDTTEQIDSLVVRAPRSGVVVRRRLRELQGTYVAQGDELLVIGDESQKELRLLIPQDKFDPFRDQSGTVVRFRASGQATQTSALSTIIPRARTEVDYPSLLATNGGPLAVKRVSNDASQSDSQFELLVPHFEAIVPLDASQGVDLHSGQRTRVSIGGLDRTVGSHLWRVVREWIAQAVQAADR